jgi:putative ABC transport system permease protein
MRARRGIRGAEKEDFYIGTAASYIELWQTISSSFVLVFVSISSISAIVGGIVIMNVMLVSVTERTKEIGVRRACGARRGDIVRQFLTESVVLCLGGGAVGVMLGFAVALLLRFAADFPADVRWWVAGLGVAFASSVGLFFGIYPAIKAADLDPVEALRTE